MERGTRGSGPILPREGNAKGWKPNHGWVYTGTNGETRDRERTTTSRTTAPALDPAGGGMGKERPSAAIGPGIGVGMSEVGNETQVEVA
jgi:hypothetical protein